MKLRTSASFMPTSKSFSALVQMSCFMVWCKLSAEAHPSLRAACDHEYRVLSASP